jgi:hypothetical protein
MTIITVTVQCNIKSSIGRASSALLFLSSTERETDANRR